MEFFTIVIDMGGDNFYFKCHDRHLPNLHKLFLNPLCNSVMGIVWDYVHSKVETVTDLLNLRKIR